MIGKYRIIHLIESENGCIDNEKMSLESGEIYDHY
jgi:hypothetical protein